MPVFLLSGAKNRTSLAYMVKILQLFNIKNLKIFEKIFLTANRSKKLKNYIFNISGTDKDILEIPTDLSSVGSKLLAVKIIYKCNEK